MFLVLLSFKNVIIVEAENQDQRQKISKSLKISPDYAKIPLYFIPNEGQVNEKALFYAKASRYTLWMTEEGLVFDSIKRTKKKENESRSSHPKDRNNPEDFTCERDISRLIFLNSKKNSEVIPTDRTEHKVNYFIGKDRSKWRTNIQTSRAVLYKELYRNIDLRVYGIDKQIEYDFIVKPGGEISDISFEYKDIEHTEIDKCGNLLIETKFVILEHAKPECYQVIEGERISVEAEFKRIKTNTYGFKVEEYNRNYELIIDPLVLLYSTYLGGSNLDFGWAIAVDSEGAAYVTGYTWSTDFPTHNAYQGSMPGLYNIFITKVNSSGDALVYSTYLGGSGDDYACGIAVDSQGAAYVTGRTTCADFPTQNPIQGTYGGELDVFITKINSSGDALVYSTYLGDSDRDYGYDIKVDSQSAAYVTGETWSADFPTQNPIYLNQGGIDAFITKVNSSGSALVYSTYLGGSGLDYGLGIAVDTQGAAYVSGYTESTDFPTLNPIQGTNAGFSDIFITKVNSSGSALVYSTYLGGSDDDSAVGPEKDWGGSIAVDSEGAAYVTGETLSVDFPTQNPIQGTNAGGKDVFITKVNSSGSALVYSTYLGGSEKDWGDDIAVDAQGAAYVTGGTWSVDFPTQSPFQETYPGGGEVFITKINSSGDAHVYSSFLGGSNTDDGWSIAVDSDGATYVTGETDSTDFPTQNPIQGSCAGGIDAFITKLYFTCSLTITAGSGGITDPSPGTYNHDYGAEITITATPNSGYTFSGWTGDVPSGQENDNPITITMDSDKSVTANFVRPYTLTIAAGSGGTTDPAPGTYTHDSGTQVSVRAMPNSGYQFSSWSGDASGTTNPITITMDSDKSITANFSAIPSDDGENGKNGGCFIATAAYGSPLHPHVETLRDFRDGYLMTNKLGRGFVDFYYRYSPYMVNIVAKQKILKIAVRYYLLPVIAFGYSMVHLGPISTGSILLLVFGFPIFLVYLFRRK